MPSVTVDLPKIHCLRQTLQGATDEVYGAVFLVPISQDGPLRPQGLVIPLRPKVSSGMIWRGLPKPYRIAMDEEAVGTLITVVLYNKNNDYLYDKILNITSIHALESPYPWEEIKKITMDGKKSANRIQLQYRAMKVAIETIKYFTMDDYLGSHTIPLFLPKSAEDNYPREFTYGERGSKYSVSLIGYFG
jgi:hypothetical protein